MSHDIPQLEAAHRPSMMVLNARSDNTTLTAFTASATEETPYSLYRAAAASLRFRLYPLDDPPALPTWPYHLASAEDAICGRARLM